MRDRRNNGRACFAPWISSTYVGSFMMTMGGIELFRLCILVDGQASHYYASPFMRSPFYESSRLIIPISFLTKFHQSCLLSEPQVKKSRGSNSKHQKLGLIWELPPIKTNPFGLVTSHDLV